MVGGGKVGGPTGTTPSYPTTTQADAKPAAATSQAPAPPSDKFELARHQAAQKATATGLTREGSGPSDILKLARNNPDGARQLLSTMLNQTSERSPMPRRPAKRPKSHSNMLRRHGSLSGTTATLKHARSRRHLVESS